MYLMYNAETEELEELAEKENTYDMISSAVGGLIELAPTPRSLAGIDLWVNEEGKLMSLTPSMILLDDNKHLVDTFAGNIVFTRTNEDGETIPLTDDDAKLIKEELSRSFAIVDLTDGMWVVPVLQY